MRRHTIVAAAVALSLVPAAAACGGSGFANSSSGSATAFSQNGTTTASGGAAGHSFSIQLRSLGSLLTQAAAMSGSQGGTHIASAIGQMRSGLTNVNHNLQSTALPSALQTQKQQLMGTLDQWNADLARAQHTAQAGHPAAAIQQARSSTYRDLKNLVDTIRTVMG